MCLLGIQSPYEYFSKVAEQQPDLRLRVERLPRRITPQYVRQNLEGRHGLLCLALERTSNRNFLFGLPAIENIHPSASQRVQCFLREDHQLRASLSGSPKTLSTAEIAQRRPGREPRRHENTNLPLRFRYLPLNEGRGVNPGDTFPALAYSCTLPTLNEGRGVNPGDNRRCVRESCQSGSSLNEGRGVNPGDTSAGRCCTSSTMCPLNEGRGVNPGDTTMLSLASPTSVSAQRRPGREPRRHRARGERHR